MHIYFNIFCGKWFDGPNNAERETAEDRDAAPGSPSPTAERSDNRNRRGPLALESNSAFDFNENVPAPDPQQGLKILVHVTP